MDVILLQKVANLGNIGDRVKVKLLGTDAEKGWIDFGRAER